MTLRLIVRDCKKSDLLDVQELMNELYVVDAGPQAEVPDVTLTYEALKGRKTKGRLLVFERAGELLGYAIIVLFWSNEFAGDFVTIDEILVTKKARNKGVGAAFFGWLKREYKTGISGWSLEVRPSKKKAERLYRRMGFQKSNNVQMHRIL